ncbi:MAG: hypothetical protein P8Y45_08550, partial [Exilibacterium sp.]
NITLSGAKTIDGVAVAETTPKTRVLVRAQNDPTENGPYDVYDTAWVRCDDFNGNRDAVDGTLISVVEGSTYKDKTWRLTTDGDIVIGTSPISFSITNNFDSGFAEQYDSVASFIAGSPATGVVKLTAYIGGWAATVAGPKGGFIAYKTGATNAAPTVAPAVSVSTIGHDAQAGYFWTADGFEWRISAQDEYSYRNFGSVGDDSTDDTQAQTDLFTFLAGRGGGIAIGHKEDIYKTTAYPAMTDDVQFDMKGSRINATLGSGSIYGLRIGPSNSGIKGGTLSTNSTGSPSSQLIFHACISVGEGNGGGGTVASPSTYAEVKNWYIKDMTLINNGSYRACIQVMGNSHHFEIDNINIPSSSACTGIHLDWSDIGPNVSSSDIALTRTTFDAGNCYTTHPSHGKISNVIAGALTLTASGDTGSYLIRLSACHQIEVSNIQAESVTQSLYRVTGGDLGYEFAPSNVKKHALKGLTLSHGSLLNQQTNNIATAVYVDTLADNIYREQFLASYSPLIDPLMHGDVEISHCNCSSLAGSDTEYGARIIQARGVKLYSNYFSGWMDGIFVDEFTKDIEVNKNTSTGNRNHGIVVGFGALREPTKNIKLIKNKSYGNGVSYTANGIKIVRGDNVYIDGNILGVPGESTQSTGLVVSDGLVSNIHVDNNDVQGAVNGIGYSSLQSTPTGPYGYRAIASFQGNKVGSEITTPIGGTDRLPLQSSFIFSGRGAYEFSTSTSSAPSDGTWYQGDVLKRSNLAASSHPATGVVASGTFGTLSGLTNAATTNTSADVAMSLQSITADTTENTYLISVNSATNLRVGLKCSIAAAGITDAIILAISGTDVQLDTPAAATQSGGAFVTAGVIDGEVISLDTTPAIDNAVVLYVTGNTVTLDTAAGSTETGRTATYTSPTFKAFSNLAA